MTADQFKVIRNSMRMTQETLAALLIVRPLTINRWENGKTCIPHSTSIVMEMLLVASHGHKVRVRDFI